MRSIRVLIGVVLLVIAAGMAGIPVMGGFSMAGFHIAIVLICGLVGMAFVTL